MTVIAVKTKAEQQLVAQFAEVADRLPGAGWVKDARRAAIGAFAASGLPHRRIEEWKYTDLRTLLKEAFPPVAGKPAHFGTEVLETALGPDFAKLNCHRYVFVNGAFLAAASSPLIAKAAGHHIATVAEAFGQPGFEWLQQSGERTPQADADPLLALNTAFATDGAILRVDTGVTVELPIHLIFVSTSTKPAAVATLNLIRIEKDARAIILETHIGLAGAARQANSVVRLNVGEGANVQHLKLTAEGTEAGHLATWVVDIAAGAIYNAFQMTESVALARHQHFVTFKGEGAAFTFNAAFLGRGNSHIDTTMVIDHAVPGCTSRETVKGVLDNTARGIFQGKVIVRPDAQKSDGKQMAKALLLSPNAEFDSKPELEIYADDVICGHGSTAAELDGDQVFYLRARGIPEPQARALLIEAFVAETIDAIESESIREAFRARLAAWLAGGGA